MQITKLTDSKTLFKLEQENFSDFYSLESCIQELLNPAKCYFCVMKNNQVIGYIGILQMLDEAEILRIAINQEHRNNGVAQFLLNFTFEQLKQKNVKNIFLEVSDKNKIAYNFYLKNSG